ncbi:MAG: F0F1 ATP synthase subunit B [Deltaproteobacteria bacterium]|nr:F0F1 ATP synthase subunit B [Deltaproteobacteria bacterium]
MKPYSRRSLPLIFFLILFLSMFGLGMAWASSGGSDESHGEAAGEAHADEGHGGISAEKVWDLVYRTMNFLAVVIILFFVLRKPLGRFFSNRREEIAETLADLEKMKGEAEESYAKLEARLAEIEAERDSILAEYIADGEKEKEKIIANAEDMSSRIQTQAEKAIAQEIKKAKDALKREIAELSASMAEELVKDNISDQDQERLVEEYLDKVVTN